MSTSAQQAAESTAIPVSASSKGLARLSCDFCGSGGVQLYAGMLDWLFGVPGQWGMRRCSDCDILWLDPQPRAEDIPTLYKRYITHTAQDAKSRLARLQSSVSQAVLARADIPLSP